ncbi:MAG: ATP-binding cassette domain-containing protein [Anaerolineae bacterium]
MATISTAQPIARSRVQAATRTASRLFYIDHLRVALAILVVLHHVAIVYGAVLPMFYYLEPPFAAPGVIDPVAYLALLVFSLFNQGWFMGAFFLLAGYFVPGSVDRKGPGAFLKERLVRLGIPLLVFYFVLNPLSWLGLWLMPPALTGITTPPSWGAYTRFVGLGPLWFVAMLFVFSLGYAGWRMLAGKRASSSVRASSAPGYLGIGLFVLALAGVSFLARMVVPLGESVRGFPTLAYLPQYLSFFVVGIIASRRGWFRTLPGSMGIFGFAAAAAAAVLLFPLAFSGRLFSLDLTALTNAFGNGHWQSAIYALWDSIFAVGMCLGLITFFRRTFNRQSSLGSFLSRHSYAVYILHIPVIVIVAYALRGIRTAPLLKFGLASLVAVPASFAVAYLVGKIPLVSRVLGTATRRPTRGPQTQAPAEGVGTLQAENQIVVRDLTKHFGDVQAVNGLNLDIKKGELFGLLGPNGAGKTTTISMLCGLSEPTAGSAYIAGLDITQEPQKVKELIGVCPQDVAVYKFLSGMENLELFGTLYGMDRQAVKERAAELVDQADFAEAARRRTKGYSGGMMRQLNLMIALISDPEIVFLDEPTVGMDARARRRTWEYIGSLKDQGKTVILTTHYIEEAQALSDRVGIIDYGELVALGSPAELMEKHGSKDLEEVFLQITGRRIVEGS